ncbi:MAG: PSD1 domain-containing protein [Candidatus Hydrogenedentes bacterium]|nr:PSD1 domain-containing protein [Candidatus Hydrogenedentota bacterium]
MQNDTANYSPFSRRSRFAAWTLVSLACLAPLARAETPPPDPAFFFEQKVRPILAARCFECHGAETQKSELRLDNAATFQKGGSRGPLVGGENLLLTVIGYEGKPQMPPPGKLPQAEIDVLTAWVTQGAPWPVYPEAPTAPVAVPASAHWSYQLLANPEVPAVQQAAWPRNEVDYFVLAKIEAAGLSPASPADRRTLLRRLTYDLTGLPPTPEAVAAFVANEAPGAFAEEVERLLATPQYGERWARHWLDVVRYTDSFDSRATAATDPVEIWRYRDWVVNAFNADMPYDQFVRYQIAGDLLPGPDGGFNRDGLIATGMLAIGNWPQGDADKEKMVADIVDDQIDMVTRGFLSSTMACARCHDHKFDPFVKEDYYGLAGIFFSSSILPGPGAKTEGSPILHLPIASKEELAARAERETRLAALRGEREGLIKESRTAWARQEAAKTGAYLLASRQGAPAGPELNAESVERWKRYVSPGAYRTLNVIDRDVAGNAGLNARRTEAPLPSSVANATTNELKYLSITQPAQSLVVHPAPGVPVRVEWQSPVADTIQITGRIADADGTCGDGVEWRVEYLTGGVLQSVLSGAVDNGASAPFASEAPLTVQEGDSLLLTIAPKGDHSCDSTVIDITIQATSGSTWNISQEVVPHFTESNPLPDAQGHPAVWWLLDGTEGLTADPVLFSPWWSASKAVSSGARGEDVLTEAAAAIQSLVDAALAHPEAAGSAITAQLLGETGPFWIATPPTAPGRLQEIDTEVAQLEAQPFPPLDYAVGIQEGPVPNTGYVGVQDVRVHRRGDYNNLGDLVPRRMPLILAGAEQAPITGGSGRVELANWLASSDNVLTARVMVNRIWQHHFGQGLVRTPGDFGKQGEAPTHPELLDYLARRFMASGWSMKEMHRLILNTAAWQQDSRGNAQSLQQDPENLLLARMNRKRLEAEALRDSLLAVSGRLDLTAGGPAFKELDTPRRTLYLRTVRSDRSTYPMLFDAADPTSIIPKRLETTVSPQALFLMNHPFMLSESERLASAMAPAAADAEGLANALYGRIYMRAPSPGEITLTREALPALGYPAPEGVTAYAQVLLNANEFVFVD